MSLTLGLCFFSFTAAALFYVSDWLEDGRRKAGGVRGVPSFPTAASLFVGVGFFCLSQYRDVENSLPELAAYVPPFPDAVVVDRMAVNIADVSVWILETPDSPQQVIDFYERIAAGENLKFRKSHRTDPWTLFLWRKDLEITINIKRTPRATEAKYFIRPFNAKPPASP